ncbi:metabolite traffic protein EboE [Nostoc sp. UCD121]|uniref:metabolite traffic protein EboE n=1 Tax=unclassified Nostoc TaxID=2593658 RepID=UPI001628C9C7|nr:MULTISPECIES: metabolite traffic protein EboE [unclassified Nostoc]MBC1218387.1 metabolite traffic protein EboE [Nostoc sp. UCD120]MBC1274433.1 metabolite traffic protein EboE [Nostoc sp. UCD121]MBC1294595.1 metabolite traffic protein EboE [Nostoc sp. UCD122]
MKITKNNNFHLTYCSNIHPGESWLEVFDNLKNYIPKLKSRLSPTEPFGIGLRLADVAAKELLQSNNLAIFQAWLTQEDLYVFTLNGFPYGGFHRQVVKDQVYAPDWSTQERVNYTLNLAHILASLLPQGLDGGISTLPLSYKPWWVKDQVTFDTVLKKSCLNIASVVVEMIRIHEKTGKILHIDLEPEPDGLIENTSEVIDYYQNWLLPIGSSYLSEKLNIEQSLAETKLLEHVRICYDTCHFSVEYEEPQSVFARLQSAGIKIGKIQISAAIKVKIPAEVEKRNLIVERLRPFAESTYLHQVIERRSDGTLHHYPDLITALPHLEQSLAEEWRTHFHVPIFIHDYQILQSTQDDIATVLHLLQTNDACSHLEIETYTWDVLPSEMKIDLLTSIQREYEWVLKEFAAN